MVGMSRLLLFEIWAWRVHGRVKSLEIETAGDRRARKTHIVNTIPSTVIIHTRIAIIWTFKIFRKLFNVTPFIAPFTFY